VVAVPTRCLIVAEVIGDQVGVGVWRGVAECDRDEAVSPTIARASVAQATLALVATHGFDGDWQVLFAGCQG